jgi:hypothetical protein
VVLFFMLFCLLLVSWNNNIRSSRFFTDNDCVKHPSSKDRHVFTSGYGSMNAPKSLAQNVQLVDDDSSNRNDNPPNVDEQPKTALNLDPFGTIHVDLTFERRRVTNMEPNCIRGNIGPHQKNVIAQRIVPCLLNTSETESRVDNQILGIAFLRIPKTASTTMLGFIFKFWQTIRKLTLEDPDFPPLQKVFPWPYFVNTNAHTRGINKAQSEHIGCVFGLTEQRGGRPLFNATPYQTFKGWQRCAHVNYQMLWSSWAASLRYVRRQSHQPNILPKRASLSTFTIVREPMDRLKSYFHFW